jgi:hypothetical protein
MAPGLPTPAPCISSHFGNGFVGLTEAAVTWMLEPLTITVKFTDDALYCPDVQVDLWTNLPEALMPSADTSLSQLEAAAASSSASVTIIADDEGYVHNHCCRYPPLSSSHRLVSQIGVGRPTCSSCSRARRKL